MKNDNALNKFAIAANTYMQEHDMHITNFCRSIGLYKNAYDQYCNGALPRVDKAIRITRVLKTTVEELFG